MEDKEALEHLLTVLRERGIPLGRDDVQWAFQSQQTRDQVVNWVQEFLGSNTLLTKDELEMLVLPSCIMACNWTLVAN
jgi:hypothetical protein